MRLSIRGPEDTERTFLVEHKIDAAETQLQIQRSESDLIFQLERYLSIPDVAGVLYFRRSPKEPMHDVLNHHRYVRPPDAPHFLWEMLYEALVRSEADSIVVRWLREGFDELGFLPPPREIGDLYHPDVDIRRRNRRSLERFLFPLREQFALRGWRRIWSDAVGNESKCEGNPQSLAHRITITGSKAGPFTIRVVPRKADDYPALARTLAGAYANEVAFRGVTEVRGDLAGSKVPSALLMFNSLAAVLHGMPASRISGRLVELVVPTINIVSQP